MKEEFKLHFRLRKIIEKVVSLKKKLEAVTEENAILKEENKKLQNEVVKLKNINLEIPLVSSTLTEIQEFTNDEDKKKLTKNKINKFIYNLDKIIDYIKRRESIEE